MSIMQIVALAVVAVVLIVVIRQERPELALQISMVAGIIILVFAVWKLVGIIKVLERMAL
ncbi:MAG TPA: stage III sporulation protein AD, partial [Firmicutes bacterium]|nr:stage III sporulation protein AD [Bacillota bacterium]